MTTSPLPRVAGACALALLVLCLVACGNSPEPAPHDTPAPVKLVLKTDWYAEPEHGGFYLAMARGYYLDEGIDLEILPDNNASNIYQQVATGQADFGLGTSDTLLTIISRDIPLVGVLPYFQRDPQGVMFHPGSGIETLADLDGRKVMMSPTLNYVEYIQRALGIRFQLLPNIRELARFVSDDSLVQQAFLTSEPWFVIQAGIEPGLIPFWEAGFEPYRLAYTRRRLLAERPELVRGFIRASLRGWREYTGGEGLEQSKTLAFAEIARRNSQQGPEFMAWTYARMGEYQLVHGRPEMGESLGQIDRARLRREIGQLAELGLLERNVLVDKVMAFQLYPEQLVVDSDKQNGGRDE